MMSDKIKMVMIKRKMNGKDLAKALNCSPQNVYASLKKDNWTEEQLKRIAGILDCDYEAGFRLSDTGERF